MKHNEKTMRDSIPPKIETLKELTAYVKSLVDGEHDYGTCVYAMSLSATAAFNFAAHKLGVTGFQASCADLDIIRRTRLIEGPFMLIKGEDMLYPQNDPQAKLNEATESWKSWLKEQAAKELKQNNTAHPDVLRHWARLAFNGSEPSTERNEIEAKAAFLENKFTETFVAEHVADFKRFGITQVYLYGDEGDVSKATVCKDGAGWRINMPVSLGFEYKLDGITIEWSVDTEARESNGSSKLNFDYAKLKALAERASEKVKPVIQHYIARCRDAMANEYSTTSTS